MAAPRLDHQTVVSGGTYVQWGSEGVTHTDSPGVWMTIDDGTVRVLDMQANLHTLGDVTWTRQSLELPAGDYSLRAAGFLSGRWAVSAGVVRGPVGSYTTLIGAPGDWSEISLPVTLVTRSNDQQLLVASHSNSEASVFTSDGLSTGISANIGGDISATQRHGRPALMGLAGDQITVAFDEHVVSIDGSQAMEGFGGCGMGPVLGGPTEQARTGRAASAYALVQSGGDLWAVWMHRRETQTPYNERSISYCEASGGQLDCGMIPTPVFICDRHIQGSVNLRVERITTEGATPCLDMELQEYSFDSQWTRPGPFGEIDDLATYRDPYGYAVGADGDNDRLVVGAVLPGSAATLRLMELSPRQLCR